MAEAERSRSTVNGLKSYTVLMKQAKRRLSDKIGEFVDAHCQNINDLREYSPAAQC